MTALHEAAQQALELCERIRDAREVWSMGELRSVCLNLRSALAQQGEQQPVAKYIGECHDGSLVQLYEDLKKGTELYAEATPATQPTKLPGMAVQALAGEIIEALLADEKDGGYDLTAGLFGANFSALVRRWAAAECNASTPQPDARTVIEQMVVALEFIRQWGEPAQGVEKRDAAIQAGQKWLEENKS